MKPRPPTPHELERIVSILGYQFSWAVAEAFVNMAGHLAVGLVRGKLRYVYVNGTHALTLRPTTGMFTISKVAGEIIVKAEPPPRFRVVISGAREIKGSVLAADVVEADPALRPGDEVVIVTRDDELVGVGRARVPGFIMDKVEYGEIVRVR